MSYKFDFAFLAERWPDFVAGAWLTIQLTVAVDRARLRGRHGLRTARVYGGPLLRRLVGAYVETIRNTPLLVQIFIVYFGLSSLGLKLSAEVSAVHRARHQHGRLHDRDHARRHRVDPAHPARGGRLPRA